MIMGCMRINALTEKELNVLVNTYLEEGVNYIDHADIYGGGECESHFAKAVGMSLQCAKRCIFRVNAAFEQIFRFFKGTYFEIRR